MNLKLDNPAPGRVMDQVKKLAALRALEQYQGDVHKAAAYLGICVVTMRRYQAVLDLKEQTDVHGT